MSSLLAPPSLATFAHQRAALLGMRAALVEQPHPYCDDHGFHDADGWAPKRCRSYCEPRGDEPFAGDVIEQELHALTYRDRDDGTKLHAVAVRMREATRREMAWQERNDERRARGEDC